MIARTENRSLGQMTRYHGKKTSNGTRVWADKAPLRFPASDLSFRPCDFDWGYNGRGPGALAFSILSHHLQDSGKALRLHGSFMRAFVANLPRDGGWIIEVAEVEAWLEELDDSP